jgi:transcription elongation factor GreA
MSSDRVPMTREGYEKEKAKLDHMQNVEMIEVAKRIKDAREMGDLSENAEYHAAREDQGMLQARIDALKDRLARASIVDQNSLPKDAVVFGARVKIKNLDSGDSEVYELVGPGDENYDSDPPKILTTSPRGRDCSARRSARPPRSRSRAAPCATGSSRSHSPPDDLCEKKMCGAAHFLPFLHFS